MTIEINRSKIELKANSQKPIAKKITKPVKKCFCGYNVPYSKCCAPFIQGSEFPNSAEKLMRSRYSAYVVGAVDYLIATTQVVPRRNLVPREIELWGKSNSWKGLEIIKADTFTVEFKAHFRNRSGKLQVHHEKSTFVLEDGRWFYVDGLFNDEIN